MKNRSWNRRIALMMTGLLAFGEFGGSGIKVAAAEETGYYEEDGSEADELAEEADAHAEGESEETPCPGDVEDPAEQQSEDSCAPDEAEDEAEYSASPDEAEAEAEEAFEAAEEEPDEAGCAEDNEGPSGNGEAADEPAEEEEVDPDESNSALFVGNIDVINAGGDLPAGLSYDSETNTLTMENYTVSSVYNFDDGTSKFYTGIYCAGTLNLVLKGNNKISCGSGNGDLSAYGIYCTYDLNIMNAAGADGSLDVDLGYSSCENSPSAIYSFHVFSVEEQSGGTLTLDVKALPATLWSQKANTGGYSCGIESYGVEIKSGTVHVYTNSAERTSYGFYVKNGQNYIQDNGTVTVEPVKGSGSSQNAYGINTGSGAIWVKAGKLSATAGDIYSSESTKVSSYGLYTTGSLTFDRYTEIEAHAGSKGSSANAESTGMYGVTGVNLNGRTTASGEDYAISNGSGLQNKSKINPYYTKIIRPAGGSSGKYGSIFTFLDASSAPAKEVYLIDETEEYSEDPTPTPDPDPVDYYDVWIGSVRLSSENKNSISGVTYDPDTNTLTLGSGLNISDSSSLWGKSARIAASGDLKLRGSATLSSAAGPVVFAGGNVDVQGSFSFSSTHSSAAAMEVSGNAAFGGSGSVLSLNAKGAGLSCKQYSQSAGTSTFTGTAGIDASQKIQMSGGELNAVNCTVTALMAGGNGIIIADGYAITSPEGGCISEFGGSPSAQHVLDGFGNISKSVTIEEYHAPDPVEPTEIEVSQADGVYGSTLAKPVWTRPEEGGTVSYCYTGKLWKDNSSYEASSKAPTLPGSYNVSVNFVKDGHIYYGDADFSIVKKTVSVNVTTVGRVYDKNDLTVAIAGASVTGLVGSDDCTVDISAATALLADDDAGTARPVTVSGVALTGADSVNYLLGGQPAGVTADIARKSVSVNVTIAGRVYRAADYSVTVSSASITGVFEGDDCRADISAAKGTMADDKAGEGKPVTVTGVTLAGDDKANYTLAAQPSGATADIEKAEWTATEFSTSGTPGQEGRVDLGAYKKIAPGGLLGTISVVSGEEDLDPAKVAPYFSETTLLWWCRGGIETVSIVLNVPVTNAQNYKDYNITVRIVGEHIHEALPVDAVSANCTEDGTKAYYKCSICGRMFSDETAQTEIHDEDIVEQALGHSWGEWHTVLEPTETEEGMKRRECSRCGVSENEILPVKEHVHVMSRVEAVSASCNTPGTLAYYKCTGCGRLFFDEAAANEITEEDIAGQEALGHNWSDWETKDPTENEDGYERRECHRCGEVEENIIPALGHIHEMAYITAVSANCTEPGVLAYYRCTKCDLMFSDEEGNNVIHDEDIVGEPALGHDWGEWQTEKEPSEAEEGLRSRVCSRCGEREEFSIPVLVKHEHTLEYVEAVSASCNTPGKMGYYICTECRHMFSDSEGLNEIYEDSLVQQPALGHNWGWWTVVKYPTAREDGLKCRKCYRCGVEQEFIIPGGIEEGLQVYFDTDDSDVEITETDEGIFETVYSGSAIKPGMIVMNNGIRLLEDRDYTLKYGNNTNVTAAGATVTVTGKGNYNKSVKLKFYILPKSIEDGDVIPGNLIVESGKAAAPVLVCNGLILKNGKDFSFTRDGDSLILTGMNNYTGTRTLTVREYESEAYKAAAIRVNLKKGISRIYNGEEHELLPGELDVVSAATGDTLEEDRDYIVSYSSNINAGTVKLTVTGIDSYSGTVTKSFKIKPAKDAVISVDPLEESYDYVKSGVKPVLSVHARIGETEFDLAEGVDYRVSYSNNKKPGTAKFKLTFKGNYKGAKFNGDNTYRIEAAQADELTVIAGDMVYSKNTKYQPKLWVIANGSLVAKSDMTVAYGTNEKLDGPREALDITVSSRNTKYIFDQKDLNYDVKEAEGLIDVNKARVTLVQNGKRVSRVEYTGREISFEDDDEGAIQICVKINKDITLSGSELDECFDVFYADNVEKGKATIILRARDDSGFCGACAGTFTIGAQPIRLPEAQ
ncbi:MAG: hypothetical protein IKI75_06080 [Lachnospiraceae bacterium]|nr:hypothetical protein [Lachnospiraceae bacterium]